MTPLLFVLLLAAQPFTGTVSGVRGPVLQVRDDYGKAHAITLPGIEPAPGQRGGFEAALARMKGRYLRVDRDGRAFQNGKDVALELIRKGLAQADPFDLSLPRDVREAYRAASRR